MTLSAFAWNIVRTYTPTPGRRYSFGCRYRLGTASNLVMYVSAADNDYVGVTSTFLGTGVWSTHTWTSRCLRSLRRVYPRAGAAVGGHAGPVQHADQGQRLRGRGLGNGPAGGLASPHGLRHAGRAHRAGQRGLRPAAVQRRKLHGRVHHGRGRLGRSLLRSAYSHRHRRRSHAVVRRGRSSATGITGSTLTINNTANAGNFTTVGDVSTGALTASGAATAASSHRGAYGRHADQPVRPPRSRWTARAWTAPLRPRAAECRRAAWCAAT